VPPRSLHPHCDEDRLRVGFDVRSNHRYVACPPSRVPKRLSPGRVGNHPIGLFIVPNLRPTPTKRPRPTCGGPGSFALSAHLPRVEWRDPQRDRRGSHVPRSVWHSGDARDSPSRVIRSAGSRWAWATERDSLPPEPFASHPRHVSHVSAPFICPTHRWG
jgi:hypothetical protein